MLVQTLAPACEPISLQDARLHLRLTDSDPTTEDPLILMLIGAARRYAESYTGRSFITQSWRLVLDEFRTNDQGDPRIDLDHGPVGAIASVVYRNMAGAAQTITWAAAQDCIQRSTDGMLIADLSGAPARISPAFGCTWPSALPESGAVAVNYTAGYGSAPGAVPQGIRQWMLVRVATLFQNRDEVSLAAGKVQASRFVDALLDPYCVLQA